jgi:hypothetical protein
MLMSRKHGMVRKLGVAGAVAGALVLALESPASASTRWLEHGWDTAQLDTGSDRIKVKDYECDGNGVFVVYKTHSAADGWEYFEVWDENGCSGNGWWEEYADDDIEGWTLCENLRPVHCSEWDNF